MAGEPHAVASDRFDWSDAGIGAGVGALAALLALDGTMVLLDRRPRAGLRSPVGTI